MSELIFKDGETVVFAGDSVTDDGRLRPDGEGLWGGLGNGFVRLTDAFLTAYYPERVIRLVNMGIGGNTSKDLLARWDADINSKNPDWVITCIGFNDVWRQFDSPAQKHQAVSPEEFRANINAMADKTAAKNIWLTPYYMESNRADAMRVRMDEYGAIVKEEAAKRKIPCIDLQRAFDDFLKYRYSAFISWDRVHPGWVGSMIIAREILKFAGFDFNKSL